jgi:uncharacterized protein (DUF1778 family)
MAQAKKQVEPVRRGLINLRVSSEDRNVIDRAAKAAGKTRTEFMIEASRRAAHDTLLDTNLIVVDGPTFRRFKKLFDAPTRPNPRLRRLLNLKPPWES